MAEELEYDPRFVEGVRHFNACDFFEAHEVWEELWTDYRGPSRRFYQGLIQVAVCLHHFGNENTRGAIKLYHGCRTYLEEYRPRHMGVDLDKLLGDLERCCKELLASQEEFPSVTITPDLIPEIHLDPPAASIPE
jgi:predicted metal-dependent hydrolase